MILLNQRPPSGNNVLTDGIAKTNLSGAKDNQKAFTMVIPSGTSKVVFSMDGGSGDADLFVKAGSAPTSSVHDCKSEKSGNTESCTITNPTAGTYHIMVKAYSAYSGASLKGDLTAAPVGNQPINSTQSNISVASKAWKRYTLNLAAGYSNLTATLTGGTGDADLFIRHGAQSTSTQYDCKSEQSANEESCTKSSPAAGTWHIDVFGYSTSAGITLNVKANP